MSNIQNQLTYANSLNLTKISLENEKGNSYHATKNDESVKNGYTLIKKNPNTQKIEIIYPYNYEAKNNEILQKNCSRGIKSMINNWNNYRDDLNDLLGDISPFYNYKETIQQMIDEDANIFEELYKHKSTIYSDNESDYYSDND